MEVKQTRTCPKCGRRYTGRPALSREDNETLICPTCGTREALETLDLEEEEIDEILGIVERNMDGECLE